MLVHRIRSLGMLLLTLLSAALLAVAATATGSVAAGLRSVTAQVLLAGDEFAYIMGGSGLPNPQEPYVTALFDNFAAMVRGGAYAGFTPQGFNTAEGLYPYTGIKDLTLDESVLRGLQAMGGDYSEIMASLTAGDQVTVVGYSQSAILSSLFMQDMHDQGIDPNQLAFVLLGDPMNANGGLLSRFPDLTMPSMGLTFYGATPADLYPTDVFSLEYDGFADFPRYPLNLLSDLNALAGIYYVHGTYPELDPSVIDGAHLLLGSQDYTGPLQMPAGVDPSIMTNYWMIETPNLPLLEPVRSIPLVGDPIADLLQPNLAYLVNLGYGDPLYGWSTAPANVATPFGLFPELSAFEKLPGLLLNGTQQGIEDFIGDFTGGGPNPVSLSLDSLTSLFGGAGAALDLTNPLGAIDDIVTALTNAVSTGYATLLPTADIVTALVTSMPLYDINLIVDALTAGDLIGAIGNPLAANMGLLSLGGGFEFLVVLGAIQDIVGDLTGLIPF